MNDVPIQIRNPDVIRAVRELASRKGRPITQALGELARAELGRIDADRQDRVQRKRAAVREAVDALHRLPIIGKPFTDDDLYDDDGLPK